jgi:hypothetical protein
VPNVLELQVWHSENGRRCLFEEFGPRHDNDPSMRLERISTAKNRFYITLDCEKRLKVQRLVLVAVLRIQGQVFVSEDAHFPPPSSKRGASPRLKGRTGPYETLLSFTDLSNDDDRLSPRQSSSSPPVSGRRRASSLKSTSSTATSSPRSGSSAEVHSWQTLVKWLLGSRHNQLPGALMLQHLAQLSSIAIDFGTFAINSSSGPTTNNPSPMITIDSIREELMNWLQSGPYHIMELLEAGFLQQCIQEPWFLGNISEAGAQAYLGWYRQRANLRSAFLVRFSSPLSNFSTPSNAPHLVLDAIWTNEQTGAPERYSASVMYDFDPQGQLYFWIGTANDATPSRSNSLGDVVRYICTTTNWSHVWRHSPSAANSISFLSSPGSPGSSHPSPYGPSSPNVDAISLTKHRSMPLLHSSPSRLHSSAGGGGAPLSPSSSNMPSPMIGGSGGIHIPGPARSPMLVIPSKIGILSHDPASHSHMSMDGSSMKVDETAANGVPTISSAGPFPNSNWNTGSGSRSNSLAPHTVEHMDTGSSESATSNSFDVKSANGSMQPDNDQIDSLTPSESSELHGDNDFSMHPHSAQSIALEQHSMLPPHAFQHIHDPHGMFSDSIGGARSLSAPTALRTTWSGHSNAASSSMHQQHFSQMAQSSADGLASPAPYYMHTGQQFGPTQGGFFFNTVAPSVVPSSPSLHPHLGHDIMSNNATFSFQDGAGLDPAALNFTPTPGHNHDLGARGTPLHMPSQTGFHLNGATP